jgi:tetratricopeptide (TPR) repeat protein
VDLEAWEQKLLAALDQYADLFPNEKKTRNIIYRSAYLLYNKNHFKEASDRFRVVIGMNPKSKEAEQAAELIVDSFVLVEDWSNLKDVSKAFYDQEGLGSAKFKKEVYNVYERASFKLIEVNLDKAGKKAEAAEGYWAFYAEFPESEVADKALNNSAVYFHATEQLMRSMKVRHELIGKFPKSEYFNDHVAELGFAYESVADFQKAAKWYEKLFSVDKEHNNAADAIYSAAMFRNALGNWLGAIKNYKAYITSYPDQENVTDISLLIGQIYEDNGKWAEAAKVYYAFFTAKDVDERDLGLVFFARLHYGLMLEKQGQTSSMNKHWQSTLAAWERVPEADRPKAQMAIEVVARIMYDQTAKEYSTFTALDVGGPGKVIGKNERARKKANELVGKQLADKAKALGQISNSYTAIISTGAGEWGIAALVRLGQCYENMGQTLKTAWVPDWLTEEQKEMYQMALEDKVYPQEEKASEAYGLALSKSFELSLYNENTAFATRRLGELRPFDYPALREVVLEPRYTTSKTTRSDFETEM